MKNLKIYGVLLIIVLLVSTKVFATEENNNTYKFNFANSNLELAKMIFEDEIEQEVEEKTYYEFIKSSIPTKFVKPFYDLTYKNKNIGIELLGTAKHESGWVKFEGPLNDNGSKDYGPLMLNSKNLENEDFMNSFSKNCEEYKYDRDIYYMCICINFYRSIRLEYGPWCALQIYNGGWRTVRKTCPETLKRKVVNYANKVYNHINKYDSSYKTFKTTHKEEYINYIAHSYTGKLYSHFAKSRIDNIVKHPYKFNMGGNYPSGKLFENDFYLFDREFYELYILYSWMPANIIIISPSDIYLDSDEEYYNKMLC